LSCSETRSRADGRPSSAHRPWPALDRSGHSLSRSRSQDLDRTIRLRLPWPLAQPCIHVVFPPIDRKNPTITEGAANGHFSGRIRAFRAREGHLSGSFQASNCATRARALHSRTGTIRVRTQLADQPHSAMSAEPPTSTESDAANSPPSRRAMPLNRPLRRTRCR
jgi:hypothetical protein